MAIRPVKHKKPDLVFRSGLMQFGAVRTGPELFTLDGAGTERADRR
jgi:hypothetical protein